MSEIPGSTRAAAEYFPSLDLLRLEIENYEKIKHVQRAVGNVILATLEACNPASGDLPGAYATALYDTLTEAANMKEESEDDPLDNIIVIRGGIGDDLEKQQLFGMYAVELGDRAFGPGFGDRVLAQYPSHLIDILHIELHREPLQMQPRRGFLGAITRVYRKVLRRTA